MKTLAEIKNDFEKELCPFCDVDVDDDCVIVSSSGRSVFAQSVLTFIVIYCDKNGLTFFVNFVDNSPELLIYA